MNNVQVHLAIRLEVFMEDGKNLLQVEDEKENTKVDVPADSFTGLPVDKLISAPLIAINEAQQQLAASSLDFYNKIAFEDDAKTRCLEFDLERPVWGPDGIGKQEVHVEAPVLRLVPVPALIIDNVNIDFQMEVTDASTSKESENADLSTNVPPNWFGMSGSIRGKVGTSRENTRSTERTAKHHVRETVRQQQQTEGLDKLSVMIYNKINEG